MDSHKVLQRLLRCVEISSFVFSLVFSAHVFQVTSSEDRLKSIVDAVSFLGTVEAKQDHDGLESVFLSSV